MLIVLFDSVHFDDVPVQFGDCARLSRRRRLLAGLGGDGPFQTEFEFGVPIRFAHATVGGRPGAQGVGELVDEHRRLIVHRGEGVVLPVRSPIFGEGESPATVAPF
jgi:hypothetical protein